MFSFPKSKPCPHINIETVTEEQPYFDVTLSEIAYFPGTYYCQDCLETVFFVDGHWFTTAEREVYNRDVDSIPF